MGGRKSDSEQTAAAPASKTVKLQGRQRHRAFLRDVEVTQEDIERALPQNSGACMIADAIKRKYPEFVNVSVDTQSIRWTEPAKKRRVWCFTPPQPQAALTAFDLGVKPRPFKFEVRSAQVTPMRTFKPKLGPDGKPVTVAVKGLKRKADGTVKEYAGRRTVREEVSYPSAVKELEISDPLMRPSQAHVVGGRLPPHHKASRVRKFGMRQFTWFDGEEPEAIAQRQQLAYGWTDEQMAANGWQFAKDRLAAKTASEV